MVQELNLTLSFNFFEERHYFAQFPEVLDSIIHALLPQGAILIIDVIAGSVKLLCDEFPFSSVLFNE